MVPVDCMFCRCGQLKRGEVGDWLGERDEKAKRRRDKETKRRRDKEAKRDYGVARVSSSFYLLTFFYLLTLGETKKGSVVMVTTAGDKNMITIKELTKTYGKVSAVAGLDLEVRSGEIFGFLGPNGAGKTTAIRVLTTLTKPTTGEAWVNGLNVVTQPLQVKAKFGIVQQHLSLNRELTAWESMELHARLHHLKLAERRQRIAELLDYVELTPHANRLVETLSGGMKRRLMIARALIHRPKLLFLDEPTISLDAQARRSLWGLIKRMNLDGATIFLTTHYIEEAEALCHRVGIIHQGKLIALGSPLELRQRLGIFTVETLSDSNTMHYHYFQDKEAAIACIQGLPPEIKTSTMRESNLEDVFVELTGQKVRED